MIRFILCLCWAVIFLVGTLPLLLIEFLIGLKWPKARAVSCQWIIKYVFKLLNLIAGVKLTVKGLERVPADRAVLYVPNHRSIFDVLILYTLCVGQTGFVAKKETRKVPIFNLWMAFMNCTFLDRSDIHQGLKIILKNVDLMKQGVSVCIFPEGTRNKSDSVLQDFHEGSFKIAEKSGSPIVPVVLTHTNEIFEDHFPLMRSKHVTIEFLDPIEVKDLSKEEKKELPATVHKLMSDCYEQNF